MTVERCVPQTSTTRHDLPSGSTATPARARPRAGVRSGRAPPKRLREPRETPCAALAACRLRMRDTPRRDRLRVLGRKALARLHVAGVAGQTPTIGGQARA